MSALGHQQIQLLTLMKFAYSIQTMCSLVLWNPLDLKNKQSLNAYSVRFRCVDHNNQIKLRNILVYWYRSEQSLIQWPGETQAVINLSKDGTS